MSEFVFSLPTRIVFGAGTFESIGTEARAYGTRALLITGAAFAKRSGLIDRVLGCLRAAGVDTDIYDGLGPNPSVESIDAGGEIARKVGADIIVGLGGGSVLDAAKAIALVASNDASIWDFVHYDAGVQPAIIQSVLPIIQVPLIASTGSEINDTAVVFNESLRIKAGITHPLLQARVAIVDPTLAFTVPPHYTSIGGINIVSQMLEQYLTSDEFPATDRVTEGLVRVVMDSLPRAVRRGEDLDASTNLSMAAVLASTVAIAGRSGAVPLQSMAQPLTAYFGVEHGAAVSALWPSFMRYGLGNRLRLPQIGRYKRYALLGRQLFGVHETDDEVAAETTSHRLVAWLRSMDMPTDLRELGIVDLEREQVTALADQAIAASGPHRRLTGGLGLDDVENVYEGALRPA